MPTLSIVPSTEEEPMETENTTISSNSAFTILNSTDNLKTYSKPNAIVRPSIRQNPPNGEDFIVKNVESQIILNGNDDNDDDGKSHYDLGSFTKELDIRLRRLQREKKGSSKNVIYNCEKFILSSSIFIIVMLGLPNMFYDT